MFSLKLLGGAAIESPKDVLTGGAVQRHRLALLALLSRAPSQQLSRDKLIGFLWPESPTASARHSLREAVWVLRKELGENALISVGDDLRLDTEAVRIDVLDFEAALESDEPRRAVDAYAGPFLDGFYLNGSGEFERWAEFERDRLARSYQGALEELAREAGGRGEVQEAVEWWRRLAMEAPYDARVAVALMEALAAAGDRAGALRQAENHARLLQEEFGAAPNPELESLAEQLRAGPVGEPIPIGESIPLASMEGPAPERGPASDVAADASDIRDAAPAIVGSIGPEAPALPRPGRRREWITGAAAMAAVLTIIGMLSSAGLLPGTRPPGFSASLESNRVLVLDFENETGEASLDPLGRMAADWIARELTGTGLVRVVSSRAALGAGSLDTAGAGGSDGASDGEGVSSSTRVGTLAREAGTAILVSGAYYRQGDSLAFQVRLVDAATGELLRAVAPVRGNLEEPEDAVEVLQMRTIGALASVLDPRLASWTTVSSQPPSFQAYTLYTQGMEAHFQYNFPTAIERFYAASAEDSTFTLPLLWAVYAHHNMWQWDRADSLLQALQGKRDRLAPFDQALLDHQAANHRADRAEAYRTAHRVVELSPDSDWMYKLGVAALHVNRPREALDLLLQVDLERGWVKDWQEYWFALAAARHLAGDHEGELADIRGRRARAPEGVIDPRTETRLLSQEMEALAALGRADELDRTLDEYLARPQTWPWRPATKMRMLAEELRAHGHEEAAQSMIERMLAFYEGLPADERAGGPQELIAQSARIRAIVLSAVDRREEVRRIWATIADSLPRSDLAWAAAHGAVGVNSAQLGDRDEALRRFELAAEFESPSPTWDHLVAYWQACIAAQLGDRRRAVALLREAFAQGQIFSVSLHRDRWLDPLRGYPPFEELMRPKG
jgi:DNA-binding SARP family transcriptional activator